MRTCTLIEAMEQALAYKPDASGLFVSGEQT
jgi:hypothetical protein